jgi:hypothetical protein
MWPQLRQLCRNLGDNSLIGSQSIGSRTHPHISTMANLSRFLLIDSVSGTVLCADQCYLVDDDALSTRQWDDMESMSDTEIGTLAINHGRKLSDVVTLRAVLPGETV